MAFQIDVSKTTIPVEIKGKGGTYTIEIDKTDEGFQRLQSATEKVLKQREEVEPKDPESAMSELKAMNKEYFDGVYGEGSYEGVYDVVQSTFEMSMLPAKIAPYLVEQFNDELQNADKGMKKYQKKPKKK